MCPLAQPQPRLSAGVLLTVLSASARVKLLALSPRRRLNRVLVVQQCAEHMAKEEFGVTADHVLRQAAALDQKEPVPAAGRRLLVDRLKAVESRDDVERRAARNFLGVIAEQPVRHPRARSCPA